MGSEWGSVAEALAVGAPEVGCAVASVPPEVGSGVASFAEEVGSAVAAGTVGATGAGVALGSSVKSGAPLTAGAAVALGAAVTKASSPSLGFFRQAAVNTIAAASIKIAASPASFFIFIDFSLSHNDYFDIIKQYGGPVKKFIFFYAFAFHFRGLYAKIEA